MDLITKIMMTAVIINPIGLTLMAIADNKEKPALYKIGSKITGITLAVFALWVILESLIFIWK